MGFLDNVRDALKDALSTKARSASGQVPPAADPDPVPAPAPAPTETAKLESYTVRSGDSLPEIGARFGVSYLEIAELNDIENPDLIFPGQVFRIPRN